MASSAWLVTTMSARPAASLAFSAKQREPNGQRCAPMHSWALTETWRQAASGTPGTSSSRSPVVVWSAHSCSRLTWRPNGEVGPVNQSGRVEQGVLRVVRHAALLPVQAQVVAPALQDGEDGFPVEQRLERRDQAGQVTVDQLALQRDGGRGDHDRAARGHRVPHRRDQVGQRLAGAGTGLDG